MEPSIVQPVKKDHAPRKLVITSVVVSVLCSLLLMLAVGSVLFATGTLRFGGSELQREVVASEGELIADLAAKVGPSVVSIRTSQSAPTVNDLFGSSRVVEGAGTGIILNTDGLVLTNKHVIPEGTTKVTVTLADGTKYDDVEVVGRDPLNDLAFVKIKNPKNLVPAKLGDSNSVRTGGKVLAIGNALGEFQNTVTSGIISGVGRPIEASDGNGATEQLTNLFQTDAAINPGNSGGPLVNFSGEVIGVNTAVAAEAQGVGFAIPINEAKSLIESVEQTGKISRPYLGVRYVMLTPDIAKQLDIDETEGAYVGERSIVADSPAQKAGLKSGDVIIKVNDTKLTQTSPLASVIGQHKVGEEVTLTVMRGGKEVQLKATLEEAPAA